MPRHKNSLAKGPAIGQDEDDSDAGKPTQRIVNAANAPRVVTAAPSSVFAVGQASTPTRRRGPRQYLDLDAVEIKTGVPIPPHVRPPAGDSVYAKLFARLPVGGMVELSPRHAAGLLSWGKKNKPGQLVRRTLRTDAAGVWRIEPKDPA